MAQTLRYIDELIDGFPDNVSSLITPENMRDFVVSMAPGRGFLDDTTPVTIPIVSDTAVLVNSLLVAPVKVEGLWRFDSNNQATSDYSQLPSTVIPAGYTKVATLLAICVFTRAGGGTNSYDFQFGTSPTALLGVPETVQWSESGTKTVMTVQQTIADISSSTVYGLYVTGVATGTDLTLESFETSVTDATRITNA